jgi:RNA polymerase sigma factor (sigma-70 family)
VLQRINQAIPLIPTPDSPITALMSTAPHTASASPDSGARQDDRRRPAFVTTHWSVVLAARDPNSPQSAQALEELCRAYWYPLYAHVRSLGNSPHDAEDLTQAFFARLLEKNYLEVAQRERGRFRTFLLMALKRFLANEWDRARAQKRGGGLGPVPLETDVAEQRYQTEAGGLPADKMFERRWAVALLAQTMARLRAEFEQAGKHAEFERLKRFLTVQTQDIAYAPVAKDLGVNEANLRVTVHRLRRRFRELFREEILHTVTTAEDLEEEYRHLLAALAE